MKKRRLDPTRFWVGFLIFMACLLGLLINGNKQTQYSPRAQFADKTPLGGRGLSLVLQKLGYSTALQTLPLQKMPADAKIWLIFDPETGFSTRETKILLAWVKKGGVLVFCVRPDSQLFTLEDETENAGIARLRTDLGLQRSNGTTNSSGFLPQLNPLSLDTVSNYRAGVKKASGSNGNFEVSRPAFEVAGAPGGDLTRISLEKGQIFVAPDALLFTNYALSKDDNAVLVTNLLRSHAPTGKVYFDERQHGENAAAPIERRTLISLLKKPPVSYAMWQFLVAGLLFWAFAGRRLGAPVPLPDRGPVTRASQFAGAMGALFSKSNRPQAAASLIGTRFRRRLASRLGLSPAESDTVLARRAQEIAGIPFEVTDRLLLQSRAPASSLSEALRDAQDMERVLQKLDGK